MIEAHSSHLIFGLSVVQADIATSKAAGRFYRDISFFTLLGSHTSKSLCSTEAPPTVSASPNIMLITALCLSPCWPINQEKYVVCSRNRGKQGNGSGSIGDPTTEGVKKWIRPFNFIEGKHCSEADNLPTLYQCSSIGRTLEKWNWPFDSNWGKQLQWSRHLLHSLSVRLHPVSNCSEIAENNVICQISLYFAKPLCTRRTLQCDNNSLTYCPYSNVCKNVYIYWEPIRFNLYKQISLELKWEMAMGKKRYNMFIGVKEQNITSWVVSVSFKNIW